MILINYQEIAAEKIIRQEALIQKGASAHAYGHAFHIGKISPACRGCFTKEKVAVVDVGTQCMCIDNCSYCYYDKERVEENEIDIARSLSDVFFKSQESVDFRPNIISFQSRGETLKYLEKLKEFSKHYDLIKEQTKINQYRYIYTNGILADEETLIILRDVLKINEIRFHMSASNFSETVKKNMITAKKLGFFVSVEEPAFPKHKEKLLELLPWFEEIGLKHLNLISIQVTEHNMVELEKEFPDDSAVVSKDNFFHLHDNGLVYDIMDSVLDSNYS